MPDRKPALGKGLSALIPDAADTLARPRASLEIDIDLLEPNDYQPRGDMEDERLENLVQSIKTNGIIQPIVARELDHGRFQIIAGERRWRAAQRAGLQTVPVVVKDVGGHEKRRRLEMALIENIQREDLNPIEEAQAYQTLVNEFGMKHDDIAAQVGRDRSSVANTVRLLRLPDEVRAEVAAGRLSMGHARAIVSLSEGADQRRVARDVLTRNLSVRETEAIVKKMAAPGISGERESQARKKDVHTRAAEEQLRLSLGTPVQIKRRGKGGVVEISFTNEDELQRIYEYLTERK
ncbi:MAG TPA: ParB/RepB/Spo0J family partition protein [Vicinamibacterales bacterium]|nr:ParB/RepB/Spo0J family partition protein [Vicinamibacterales bacterium]